MKGKEGRKKKKERVKVNNNNINKKVPTKIIIKLKYKISRQMKIKFLTKWVRWELETLRDT